MAIETEHKMC